MYGGIYERGHAYHPISAKCREFRERTKRSCVAHSRGSGHNARDKRLVWDGKHLKTKSGLKKADLIDNVKGRIVSRRAHDHGLRAARNLVPRDRAGMAALRALRCPRGQHKVNGNCVQRAKVSPRKRRPMGSPKKSPKKKGKKGKKGISIQEVHTEANELAIPS